MLLRFAYWLEHMFLDDSPVLVPLMITSGVGIAVGQVSFGIFAEVNRMNTTAEIIGTGGLVIAACTLAIIIIGMVLSVLLMPLMWLLERREDGKTNHFAV